jgi:hypothetical protein
MTCCVQGCQEHGTHRREFTITGEPGMGEYETVAHFCCVHIDALGRDKPPYLDLKVTGTMRHVVTRT